MTANELTAGQIFIVAEDQKVTILAGGKESKVRKPGDLRFLKLEGETAIAILAHMHCARVIFPASAKVSPKT